MLWGLLFGGLFLLCLAGIYFLIYRVHKFRFVSALSHGNKAVGWLISTAVILVPSAFLWEVWGYMNTVIVLLHLAVFWGAAALIQWGLQNVERNPFRDIMRARLPSLLPSFIWRSALSRPIMSGRRTTP